MNLNKYILIFLLGSFLFSDENNIENEEKLKNPELAWKLSLVPGLGQFYNGQYLKGLVIFSSEAALLKNISLYSVDIAMRNSLIWWALGIYVLNIVDAYIEAEMSTFSEKQKQGLE